LVHKFGGRAHGDSDSWEAQIEIEIRTDNDESAGFAIVEVAGDALQPGSQSLQADEDGKIDVRIGDFSTPSVRLTIVNVRLDGFTYRPALNEEPGSILIEGPG